MLAIADTLRLVEDEIITPEQARIIEARGREAKVALAVNSVLCLGIVSATAGLIFWLKDALVVAFFGSLLCGAGFVIFQRGGALFRMFANSAILVGAGMLIGGAGFELVANYRNVAGLFLATGGAAIALAAGWLFCRRFANLEFVVGCVLLMGAAAHLVGLGLLVEQFKVVGVLASICYFYSAMVIAGAGWVVDVRFVTAFAIIPFAQMLHVDTGYFRATYFFSSPESTISILQMAILIGFCAWVSARVADRTRRHARTLAVMAFIVANLCALVGSIWGDVLGATLWGPGHLRPGAFSLAEGQLSGWEAFQAGVLVISDQLYSVLWAVALAVLVFWAAHRNLRGLFNTALTFGAIHAYTQLFESFYNEPAAYAIGGFAAIPFAWGVWRLNKRLASRAIAATSC
ncbi:MAG: hypothetical protein QNJ84_11690 [Alphaproteobacteria bacterium]|nr:hypothetical protein [Alphaproteobacteria bacterium]